MDWSSAPMLLQAAFIGVCVLSFGLGVIAGQMR